MDFKTMAMNLFPFWILGLVMVFATISAGYKDLLRVEPKAVGKWLKLMGTVTLFRIVMFKLSMLSSTLGPHLKESLQPIMGIPWQGTLFVFWEDAVHGLPIILLGMLINQKWYSKVAYYGLMALIMISFGLGHTYQGNFAAMMLSLYIPFTVNAGKKYGVGTVMACHTIYDLTTILTFKLLLLLS